MLAVMLATSSETYHLVQVILLAIILIILLVSYSRR